jgi:hypothetical protein
MLNLFVVPSLYLYFGREQEHERDGLGGGTGRRQRPEIQARPVFDARREAQQADVECQANQLTSAAGQYHRRVAAR